jgi:2-keto-3-deoxy-6-phosphogluconate aldolase
MNFLFWNNKIIFVGIRIKTNEKRKILSMFVINIGFKAIDISCRSAAANWVLNNATVRCH